AQPEPLPARWPGALAMWLGGAGLTTATLVGGGDGWGELFCGPCGRNSKPDEGLQMTSITIGGSILAELGGMMYLAWVQPPDEAWPRSPGVTSLISGAIEAGGGVLRALMVSGVNPKRDADYRSCAFIIGSGAVALVA